MSKAPPSLQGCKHIPVCTLDNAQVYVHVVDKYKHLGSFVDYSLSLTSEAFYRAKSAMASFGPMSKSVLSSTSLPVGLKLQLAWSLIFSGFFFNVHVWSSFEGKPYHVFFAESQLPLGLGLGLGLILKLGPC